MMINLPTDDGLSLGDVDLRVGSYSALAARLGLSDRRPVPDPLPFPHPDPLGATTLPASVSDPSDNAPGESHE